MIRKITSYYQNHQVKLLYYIAISILAAIPNQALDAQPVPDEVTRQAEHLQEQLQQQARERSDRFEQQRTRPPSGVQTEEAPPPASPDSGCAAVREVRVVGMTIYGPQDFADALAALRGACVGVGAIDAALRAITNRYVKDGYVTSRAVVGPQSLSDGVLTITVIEGRTEAVQGADGQTTYGPGEIGAALPGQRGRLLNLRAIEQGVDQLSRMAKAEPSIDIAPGSLPGTSIVLIKRRPAAPWLRPALSLGNGGSTSTGRWQGSATIDADSLLGVGDVWSLYYQRDADSDPARGTYAYGGFVSLPYGWWTLSLSGGISRYHSVLAGNGLSFTNNGESWNAGATLDRMIWRDARNKLSASAGLQVTDTANFIRGIRLQTSSYRIVSARAGGAWQRLVGKSQLSTSLEYARGLGVLGAHTVDTGPGGATGQFNLIEATVALTSPTPIGRTRASNTLLIRGQWGFDSLFPAQRFSLGGSSTVRGFRDDGVSGRSGVSLRDQFGFGIADLGPDGPGSRASLSGFLAYDAGLIVPAAADPYERGVLQSVSAGLRTQSARLQGELTISVPVSAPAFVRHDTALVSANVRLML